MMNDLCKTISETLGDSFSCAKFKNMFRVSTPFSYPDGGSIELFVEDDYSSISDLGETMRWLYMQSFSSQRSPAQMKLINGICDSNDVMFEGGAIRSRVSNCINESLINTVQACMRVSDISMSFRGRTIRTAIEDFSKFLDTNSIGYEPNKQFEGLSGRKVYIDFLIPKADKNDLVKVLTTASKSQSTRIVNNTLRTWTELKQEKDSHNFVTVFDDTSGDIWSPGDVKIIETESETVRWSNEEDLIHALS